MADPNLSAPAQAVKEEWRGIAGFDGYEVSNLGRVRSWRHKNGRRPEPKLLRQVTPNHYKAVGLEVGNGRHVMRVVNRLVLETFVGPAPSASHHAAHENGDKSDNRLANLSWKTPKANCADRERHGTAAKGERQGSAKLTAAAVQEIRRRRANGEYATDLAREFGVTSTTIYGIERGRIWRHVPDAG